MFYATELTYPHPLLAINYMIQFGERFKGERKEERKYDLDLDQNSSQYIKRYAFSWNMKYWILGQPEYLFYLIGTGTVLLHASH